MNHYLESSATCLFRVDPARCDFTPPPKGTIWPSTVLAAICRKLLVPNRECFAPCGRLRSAVRDSDRFVDVRSETPSVHRQANHLAAQDILNERPRCRLNSFGFVLPPTAGHWDSSEEFDGALVKRMMMVRRENQPSYNNSVYPSLTLYACRSVQALRTYRQTSLPPLKLAPPAINDR